MFFYNQWDEFFRGRLQNAGGSSPEEAKSAGPRSPGAEIEGEPARPGGTPPINASLSRGLDVRGLLAFGPCVTSNWTFCPSLSVLKPLIWIAEKCANKSSTCRRPGL